MALKRQFAVLLWVVFQVMLQAQEFELPADKISEALIQRANFVAKLKQFSEEDILLTSQKMGENNSYDNEDNNRATTFATEINISQGRVSVENFIAETEECEDCECGDCDDCIEDDDSFVGKRSKYETSYEAGNSHILTQDRCVVFSWQVLTQYRNDGRWGRSTIGNGNEFRVAVASVRAAEPALPIFLFTNVPAERIDDDIRENITVVEVDLMAEAGLYSFLESTKDSKVGFGTKPQALITGWERGILPKYVLYLDVDIIVTKGTSDFNLDAIFQPLKFYDISACYEGYALGPRPTPAVGAGWEINTGVMGLRRSSLGLLRNWLAEFKERQAVYTNFISGEQQALMVALERSPAYRVYPLPSVFNFRRPTVLSMAGPEQAVIVQTHVYSDLRLKVSSFLQVAHEAAIVMMEDCLHHMKKVGLPTHFLCGALVG